MKQNIFTRLIAIIRKEAQPLLMPGALTPVEVQETIKYYENNEEKEMPNPTYQAVLLLEKAIDASDTKNIAVTGEYGAGKSSVINTAVSNLKQGRKHKGGFILISLASLCRAFQDENMPNSRPASKKTKEIERQIEFSILQQILYYQNPNITPRSSFNRLHKFSIGYILKNYISPFVVLVSCIIVLYAPSWLTVPSIAERLSVSADVKFWVDLFVLICGIGVLCFIIINCFNLYRLPVKKVSISNMEVEMNKLSTFNHYLDELFYFFSSSKESTVIFEDLDRIGDDICKQVYNKLRELNSLLNSNVEIAKRHKKITFVYAVKDKLFDEHSKVKFFDYIIPIIPVVDTSNAYEHLSRLLSKEDMDSINEGNHLRNLAIYFEDMRLIQNIVNDFNIYKINLPSRAVGITMKKLFGLMVYKNYFPSDFSELCNKHGCLAEILNKKEQYLTYHKTNNESKIKNAMAEIDRLNKEKNDKERQLRKEYVDAFVNSVQRIRNWTSFIIESSRKDINSFIESESEFNKLINSNGVNLSDGVSSVVMDSFSVIERRVNANETYDERLKKIKRYYDNEIANNQVVIKQSNEAKQRIPDSIGTLFEECEEKFNNDFNGIFERLVKPQNDNLNYAKTKEHLLRTLLFNDFIDEEYQYYLSRYYPNSLSPKEHTFIIESSSRSKLNYTLDLENPVEIIQRHTPEDFRSNKYLLNCSLVSEIYGNNIFKSYRRAVEENISSSRNKEFLLTYYQYQDGQKDFFSNILKKWDLWTEIEGLDKRKEERNVLLRIYLRYVTYEILPKEKDSKLCVWLSNNYSFLIENAQQIGESRLVEIIRYFKVKFATLLVRSLLANSTIADIVIDEAMFAINRTNVRNIVSYHNQLIKYESASLSTLVEVLNKNSYEYLSSHLDTCVKNIFPETSIEENDPAKLQIINSDILNKIVKQRYLSRQNKRINEVEQIAPKQLTFAYENLLVEYSWHNLFYYSVSKNYGIPPKYVNALCSIENIGPVGDSLSTEDEMKLADIFIYSNELDISCYERIVDYFSAPFVINSKLDKNHMRVLVTKKKIEFNVSNFSSLKNKYSLGGLLLTTCLCEYLKTPEQYQVGCEEIKAVMSQIDTMKGQAQYLKSISSQNIVPDFGLSQDVIKLILKNKISVADLNPQLLITSIKQIKDIEQKEMIGLRAIYKLEYNADTVKELLNAIGGEYCKFISSTGYSYLKNTKSLQALASFLKKQSFIKDYSIKKDKIIITK